MASVEIYSGQNCSYCRSAKTLLDQNGISYIDYDVSINEGHKEEFTRRLPRARSIPQIFIGGEHIGGYDDLVLLNKSGRLAELTGPARS